MTISSSTSISQYNGNAVTTEFSTGFVFSENAEVVVQKQNTTSGTITDQVLGADYTLTGAGSGSAGTVTMTSAPAVNEILTITRDTPLTQEVDLTDLGPFPAEDTEGALDKLTRALQDLQNQIDLALKFPSGESTTYNKIFGNKVARANKAVTFDSTGALALVASGDESGDTVLSSAPGATTARSLAARFGDTVTPYDFGAVGDGATDDSAAIQLWFDSGKTLLLVPGIFRCTTGMDMDTAGQKLIGMGGELRYTAGVTNDAGIQVNADYCEIHGAFLSNPNELQAQTGGRNVGILVYANFFQAHGNRIKQFQNGIQVASDGEYQHFMIHHNFIEDLIGAGDGPADLSSSLGEDRGDGITVWASTASIVGNVVKAKAGEDCRIGIHVEGLGVQEDVPITYSNQLFTIQGNVVYGPFRRMIAAEDVQHCTITGNVVTGGGWWSIAVIRAIDVNVTGNTVLYDCDSTAHAGQSYSPEYAGIELYGRNELVNVVGNTIYTTGDPLAAINVQGLSSGNDRNADIVVEGNNIVGTYGSINRCRYGIRAVYSDNVSIVGNKVRGAKTSQVYLFACTGKSVNGNTLDGVKKYQTKLVLTSITGTFSVGETVTGGTSSATGTLKHVDVTDKMLVIEFSAANWVAGMTFQAGETVTGGTSGASGAVTATGLNKYGDGIHDENGTPGGMYNFNRVTNVEDGIEAFNFVGGQVMGNHFKNVNDAIDLFGSTYFQIAHNYFESVNDKYDNTVGNGNVKLDDFGETSIYYEASATFDPGNVNVGAQVSNTVTVTGAALGDSVPEVSFSLDLQGLNLHAYVSAANTVTYAFANNTAGAIDLASGTVRVRVARKAASD